MYQVDVYLRGRKAVMVDGMSIREASRVFGLHRDTVRKMTACWQPAKLAHFETREIRGLIEVS